MSKSSKGSSFERTIAAQLSEWWSKGERNDIFWRTSQSGGRATSRNKKGLTTYGSYGDITAIDPIGQPLIKAFTIELKRGYSRDTIQDIFDLPEDKKETSTYYKWIEKAEKDSRSAESISWVLITRRDRRVPLIFIKTYLAFSLSNNLNRYILCSFKTNQGEVSCYLLEDFLNVVSPDDIFRLMMINDTSKP